MKFNFRFSLTVSQHIKKQLDEIFEVLGQIIIH
jgi:hypothetical protein